MKKGVCTRVSQFIHLVNGVSFYSYIVIGLEPVSSSVFSGYHSILSYAFWIVSSVLLSLKL